MVQLLVEQQQELIVQRSRLRDPGKHRGTGRIPHPGSRGVSSYAVRSLAEAERKADGLRYDIAKSEQKINAQYLTAPIDGTVQQLAIHTIGGVSRPLKFCSRLSPPKAVSKSRR